MMAAGSGDLNAKRELIESRAAKAKRMQELRHKRREAAKDNLGLQMELEENRIKSNKANRERVRKYKAEMKGEIYIPGAERENVAVEQPQRENEGDVDSNQSPLPVQYLQTLPQSNLDPPLGYGVVQPSPKIGESGEDFSTIQHPTGWQTVFNGDPALRSEGLEEASVEGLPDLSPIVNWLSNN